MNDLVSIIMLSRNDGRYVEESVRSVLEQTYLNWELLFVAEEKDEAMKEVLALRAEDAKILKENKEDIPSYSYGESRIKVSYIVGMNDVTPRRNSALKEARGRWITFLDVGDIWEPAKLERQIDFMKEHGYAFSYTNYSLINKNSEDRGYMIGGKDLVTYQDMIKCCWPAYLTVMYDAEKIGTLALKNVKGNNDYALWLKASKVADCYLLDESLAKLRTSQSVMGKFLLTNNIKWRYEVYHEEMGMNPLVSSWYTVRNGCYGIWKWWKYVKRVK